MGKNKLKKFDEMSHFGCVFQYPYARLAAEGFDMRGHWGARYFGNDNPIVLELGCGKGEYTVGLARRFPDKNFIGIDIKGARIWRGAKDAEETGLKNAAFLRTDIELIDRFFAPGEVSEVWITFPDPQMQKCRKRLTGARFLNLYRRIVKDGGLVHLKTDSPFLFEYTSRLLTDNDIAPLTCTADLYAGQDDPSLGIRTFYETQWLARGKKIKYINFPLLSDVEIKETDDSDIPRDDYHSYPRGVTQCMPDELAKLNSNM